MSRIGAWFERRLGMSGIIKFLSQKEVPQHEHTVWYYTGSAVLLFLAIQIVTGIMLALYYQPTIEGANASVARIMTEIPLGWLIRSVHSWSATFMIAIVFVHMLSIAFLKSYRAPRELTWATGVVLLALSLAFGFTGYLLPWDELSLAATKVGTDLPKAIPVVGAWLTKVMRGGEDVAGDTLTRFFIVHVCVLPLSLLAVLGGHIFLIQRHGISLPLRAERKNETPRTLPFWPNFVLREAMVWLALFSGLLTIAIFFAPSLGPAADLMAPAPAGIKPEWYFLFLFQTLKLFPANILGVPGETVGVGLITVAAAWLFFLPLIDTRPAEKKGRVVTGVLAAFLVYALAMSVWSLL
jgi:cytochrome b6